MKSVFWVVGNDTEVGKTFISGLLCKKFKLAYWKPFQSGSIFVSDANYVKNLGCKIYPTLYEFSTPQAINIAAKCHKININLDLWEMNLPVNENLIIENAGGILSPINDDFLFADLIKKTKIPVILVIKSKIGMINQTLLSIEALRSRDIKIFGLILNGKKCENEVKNAIEKFSEIKITAEIGNNFEIWHEKLFD